MSQQKSRGFEVGDVVVTSSSCYSAEPNTEYVVRDDSKDNPGDPLGIGSKSGSLCHCTENWVLIKKAGINKLNMNLIEKAKLVFKGEPEKSFIQVGVMDSNENLTAEGQQLFLTYLLKKNGDDFKTTVVDPILAADATK